MMWIVCPLISSALWLNDVNRLPFDLTTHLTDVFINIWSTLIINNSMLLIITGPLWSPRNVLQHHFHTMAQCTSEMCHIELSFISSIRIIYHIYGYQVSERIQKTPTIILDNTGSVQLFWMNRISFLECLAAIWYIASFTMEFIGLAGAIWNSCTRAW